MSDALHIEGLHKRLGTFALVGVELRVPRGTITGLVGANGAGKSTLFKLLLGLLAPDRGVIRILGEDLQAQGPRLRARIGFVQESPTLPGQLRVPELGRFVAPFYPSWDEAEFQRLLRAFELPLKTPYGKLSQGNRMKAAISLALAHRPELLLLDEPTSGLDPLSRREFLDLLLEVVQDEARAVLFSTHITSDLDRIADHAAFIKQGRILLAGAKDDLLEDWILVKGGEELLATPLGQRARGGQRTEFGVELLCPAQPRSAVEGALVERPRLEDLLYLFDRSLDSTALEVAPCSR
jgi:ABC-2 type transport system ATP-binding protein